mmetsp:Transcript_14611/g.36729  ORF Transcript_14611/g.36729 Transcript_14611/m.36729 type:complete len:255 (-) Transcript_14611:737-1501(-)
MSELTPSVEAPRQDRFGFRHHRRVVDSARDFLDPGNSQSGFQVCWAGNAGRTSPRGIDGALSIVSAGNQPAGGRHKCAVSFGSAHRTNIGTTQSGIGWNIFGCGRCFRSFFVYSKQLIGLFFRLFFVTRVGEFEGSPCVKTYGRDVRQRCSFVDNCFFLLWFSVGQLSHNVISNNFHAPPHAGSLFLGRIRQEQSCSVRKFILFQIFRQSRKGSSLRPDRGRQSPTRGKGCLGKISGGFGLLRRGIFVSVAAGQ